MVKGGKELSDVEGKNARVALSELASPDKMSKVYTRVCCGSLLDAPKLMRVDETVG